MIFYILGTKEIIANLYKLHFLPFHFSLQPNKKDFHPFIFPSLQLNTKLGKTKYFLSFHHFLSSQLNRP